MTTGYTLYSTISSLVNPIYEAALFTLRENNLLAKTVRVFNDTAGMNPRKVTLYNSGNFRAAAEGEAVTPTMFDRTLLNTLTPARYADTFLITDQRLATDPQNVRADAAFEMGGGAAEYVDSAIAALYSSLTGGTVGSAGGTITWANLSGAYAILRTAKVKGPLWCALHPYQWNMLRTAASQTGIGIGAAPAFADRMTQDYYLTSLWSDLYFVITPAITAGTAAVGAMYSPDAMAYDERKAFNIRPQRNENREAVELNSSLWFAAGTWAPLRGVQLIGTAPTPS